MVVGALLLVLGLMYLKSRTFAAAGPAVVAGGDKVIYVEEQIVNGGYAPQPQPMSLPQQEWQYDYYPEDEYYSDQYQPLDGYGQRRVAFSDAYA